MTDFLCYEELITISQEVGGLDKIHEYILTLKDKVDTLEQQKEIKGLKKKLESEFTRGYDEAVSECSVDTEFLDEKDEEIECLEKQIKTLETHIYEDIKIITELKEKNKELKEKLTKGIVMSEERFIVEQLCKEKGLIK